MILETPRLYWFPGFLLIVLLLGQSLPPEEPTPHFGDVTITQGNILSRDGGIIISADQPPYQADTMVIEAWDNHASILPSGQPRSSISLGDDFTRFPSATLSPDDHFLAISMEHEIIVLSVPDLMIVERFSAPAYRYPGELGWSVDGRLLAFRSEETTLMVWNVETGETFEHHRIGPGRITSRETGWLVTAFQLTADVNNISNIAFWSCSLFLEQCRQYTLDESKYDLNFMVMASADGDTVLVANSKHYVDTPIRVWRHQSNEAYVMEADPLMAEAFCGGDGFLSFSPDGRYFATCHEGHGTRIWDTETLSLVQQLELSTGTLAFIPDSDYLVGLTAELDLILYKLGEEASIDTLNACRLEIDCNQVDGYFWNIESMSQDGQWMIVRLSATIKLLVPIIFQ